MLEEVGQDNHVARGLDRVAEDTTVAVELSSRDQLGQGGDRLLQAVELGRDTRKERKSCGSGLNRQQDHSKVSDALSFYLLSCWVRAWIRLRLAWIVRSSRSTWRACSRIDSRREESVSRLSTR